MISLAAYSRDAPDRDDSMGNVQTTRRGRRIWLAAILLALIAAGLLYLRTVKTDRFYAFAGYLNAVHHYVEQHGELPDQLRDLESEYNYFDRRRTQIPAPPWFRRPLYRSVKGLSGGPFILLVETRPPFRYDGTRLLIWVNADGTEARIDSVWEFELDGVLDDDEQKRRGSKTQPL